MECSWSGAEHGELRLSVPAWSKAKYEGLSFKVECFLSKVKSIVFLELGLILSVNVECSWSRIGYRGLRWSVPGS